MHAGRRRAQAWRLHRERHVLRSIAILCVLSAHIGCYNPSLADCTIKCSAPDQCAGDQVCTAQGFCAGPDVKKCTAQGQPVTVDAAAVQTADAPAMSTPDARDLCSQGCPNGTCINGVCTIDCSAEGSCDNGDVICPVNLPCHVICGDDACTHKINCTMALSCDIECTGTAACGDEIQCAANKPCDVMCSGSSSCKRRTKCGNACSCDVTCSGPGSCAEASECPDATCRVGNACSSLPPGCDSCP